MGRHFERELPPIPFNKPVKQEQHHVPDTAQTAAPPEDPQETTAAKEARLMKEALEKYHAAGNKRCPECGLRVSRGLHGHLAKCLHIWKSKAGYQTTT